MVWRSRVIAPAPRGPHRRRGDGARTCTAAAGCATGIGAPAARSIAASMSPLVTRPSLPVPGTVAGVDAGFGGEPAHRRRERRIAQRRPPAVPASERRGGRSGGRAAPSRLGWRRGGFAAAAAAPALICPSSAPTATVSPSLATMSPSTPAAGAGTSMVTLSVSSSTSGSSTATASPAFLNHLPMVASVTDSPSVGTRISVMEVFLIGSFCGSQSPVVHSVEAAFSVAECRSATSR